MSGYIFGSPVSIFIKPNGVPLTSIDAFVAGPFRLFGEGSGGT